MRLRNPLTVLSLRWRLTLWSTLVVGVAFLLVSTISYVTVKSLSDILYAPLYASIDENMRNLSRVDTMIMLRAKNMDLPVTDKDQFGPVYLTTLDKNGKPYKGDQYIPVSESLFQEALTSSDGVFGTITLPNGSRVRVRMTPIYQMSPITGSPEVEGVLQAATRLDLLDQFANELRKYYLTGAIIIVLVVAGGSYLVAGRALRVVNKVTEQAHQIETSQDLSQRIHEPGTNDEVGNLARTFNQMLDRLEKAFAAQRRFVADSSHELRTPITVIRGNLHLMRKTTDPAERTELINITEGEISRLNRMVNDLLYMAQMQAGYDLKPVLRPVELDSLLLDVFALARSMAALKEQKIVLVHEDIASTSGDRDQLQHLLLNLLDNAVKYTPEHGVVTLGLWADEGWARVEVGDTGPGVSEEDMPLLFDRFFRSQNARKTARDGAGLGLSIVKAIADAHNGRVEIFSQVGDGTTFRVWLPVAEPGSPALSAQSSDPDAVDNEKVRRIHPAVPAIGKLIKPRIRAVSKSVERAP